MFVSHTNLDDSSPDSRVVFNVEPNIAFADNAALLAQHINIVQSDTRVHRFGLAGIVSPDHQDALYMPNYIPGPLTRLQFSDLRQGMENIVIKIDMGGYIKSSIITEPIVAIDNSDCTFRTDNSGWLGGRNGYEFFQQHYWVTQTVQGDGVNTELKLEDVDDGEYILYVDLQQNKLATNLFVYNAVTPSMTQNVRLIQCVEQSFTHGVYRLYPSVALPIRTAADIPAMPGAVPDPEPKPVEPKPKDEDESGGAPGGVIPPMPGDKPATDRPANADWWTGKEK
jgi:hypothetical protein